MVIVNIIMQWKRGFSMPSDINIGVFGFLTGELGLLSFIKRSKLKNKTVQTISEDQIQLLLQKQIQQNNNNSQGAG